MSKRENLQKMFNWLDDCDNARDDIDYIFDITGTYTNGVPGFRTFHNGNVRHWTKPELKNFKELDKLRKKSKRKELDELLIFMNKFLKVPYIHPHMYDYDRNGFVYLKERDE